MEIQQVAKACLQIAKQHFHILWKRMLKNTTWSFNNGNNDVISLHGHANNIANEQDSGKKRVQMNTSL